MRIKLLTIMILPLLLLECQTSIWTLISRKDSKLYNETEKTMIAETTLLINFKYGYDPDLDIDYVCKSAGFNEKDLTAKSPEMNKILSKYKPAEFTSFYEKIVQLRETQLWKMNFYKERRQWANFTYLEKYILPDTNQFIDMLEKNVLQLNPDYKEVIDKRKVEIKQQVSDTLTRELEEQENMYKGKI